MKKSTARIQSLDALKGFALFGILVINIQLFSGWAYLGAEERETLSGGLDGFLKPLIDVLAQGKFYSLFALLFGYSFVMLALRTDLDPADHHLRRMLGLLVLGVVHAALLWPWDILHLCAAVGMLLTPFLLRQPRTLLLWWRRPGRIGSTVRDALAPAGRMALTNYVLQSAVCVVVF